MAMIHCPECEKEISDKANACPFCGYPFNSKDRVEESEKIIQNTVPNKQLGTNKRTIIIIGICIGVIGLLSITFFAFKKIQSQARIDSFNSELQSKLMESLKEGSSTQITVDGTYADLITLTQNGDGFRGFLATAKNEAEKKTMEELVAHTYALYCLGFFKERQLLIVEYSGKEEYLYDEIFMKIQDSSPRCRILDNENTFEYYNDNNGDVLTINGTIVETD